MWDQTAENDDDDDGDDDGHDDDDRFHYDVTCFYQNYFRFRRIKLTFKLQEITMELLD